MESLLDTILTLVDERRHKASQRYEAAKANANDGMDRQGSIIKMGMNEVLEKQMKDLRDEIEAVICHELGDDWRTS